MSITHTCTHMVHAHMYTQGLAGNPLLSMSEFINNKLTAKATRQLQGKQSSISMFHVPELSISLFQILSML